MELMNEIPISLQGPKGGKARFLQDAERNAPYFGEFKPRYFIGPGSEKTWNFEKCPGNHKENEMNCQSKLRMCILYRRIQSWKKDVSISRERRTEERRGKNMHFSASEFFEREVVLDLISWANDFCDVFGICDCLGKINEIDLESRQKMRLQLFLLPECRRPSLCLD